MRNSHGKIERSLYPAHRNFDLLLFRLITVYRAFDVSHAHEHGRPSSATVSLEAATLTALPEAREDTALERIVVGRRATQLGSKRLIGVLIALRGLRAT